MTDYIETLKNVIAQAPRLVERDTVIGRNIADLQIAASGDGENIHISSRANNNELLRAVNRYLRNLGLDVHNFVSPAGVPQERFTGDGKAMISLEVDLWKDKPYASESLKGGGMKPLADMLDALLKNPARFKDYYTLVSKLNQLTGVDLDYVVPKNVRTRQPDKNAIIEVNFMDFWSELKHKVKDIQHKHVELEDQESDTPASRNAKKLIGETGHNASETDKLMTIKGYTNENFYKGLFEELNNATGGKAKMKVHPSFAWNPNTVPSVLEVPVDAMLDNSKAVNALLDQFLKNEIRIIRRAPVPTPGIKLGRAAGGKNTALIAS